MPGSFRIGKLAGIEVSIHMSWILIVVLLTWSGASGWFPALTSLLIGGLAYLFLFLIRGGTYPLATILGTLAASNVLLGIFNLVPAFPWMEGAFCAQLSGRSVAMCGPLPV